MCSEKSVRLDLHESIWYKMYSVRSGAERKEYGAALVEINATRKTDAAAASDTDGVDLVDKCTRTSSQRECEYIYTATADSTVQRRLSLLDVFVF